MEATETLEQPAISIDMIAATPRAMAFFGPAFRVALWDLEHANDDISEEYRCALGQPVTGPSLLGAMSRVTRASGLGFCNLRIAVRPKGRSFDR